MIKYLKRTEHGIQLADDGEVEKELDVILQKKGEAHRLDVAGGGFKLRKSNNTQAIKEETARLKNFSFTPPERARHEEKLQSLKAEAPILEKALADSREKFQLALKGLEESEKSFKDTYFPFNVVSLEEILKLKGGSI